MSAEIRRKKRRRGNLLVFLTGNTRTKEAGVLVRQDLCGGERTDGRFRGTKSLLAATEAGVIVRQGLCSGERTDGRFRGQQLGISGTTRRPSAARVAYGRDNIRCVKRQKGRHCQCRNRWRTTAYFQLPVRLRRARDVAPGQGPQEPVTAANALSPSCSRRYDSKT